ncbi:hypothetical protein O185_20550 [Photorhabdus temperata J3]|uniref:Uncharacterized protein n=1 Tax=Photorhabdus temperata J3 TaxID=1389415 RepID=U7QTC3_PHOTE|nr:hypothetical protein O185_20550 [Photorhabdus temperata J3]
MQNISLFFSKWKMLTLFYKKLTDENKQLLLVKKSLLYVKSTASGQS